MITTVIMVSLALTWLLYETDFMRVRLETGSLQSKSSGIETVLNSTVPRKFEPIICRSGSYDFCERSKMCHKDKERWFGYKLPAKTFHLFGHTQTFNAGCNQLRAGMLQDIIKAHTAKPKKVSVRVANIQREFVEQVRTGSHKQQVGMRAGRKFYNYIDDYKTSYHDCLPGKKWLKSHSKDTIPEATIELSVNGKTLSFNGDYKPGMIRQFVKVNK